MDDRSATFEVKAGTAILEAKTGRAPIGRAVCGSAFVLEMSAATTLCEANYIMTVISEVGSPVQHYVELPGGVWEQNPAVAQALADIITFRPEPEDVTDGDLEKGLPSYPFPD